MPTTHRFALSCLIVAVSLATTLSTPATAQISGTGIRSLDIYGRSCFTTEGVARAQPANPQLFNHVVIVNNRCTKSVKLKVCYHKTERCAEITVPPHETKEAWLGSVRLLRFFQYDLKELPRMY